MNPKRLNLGAGDWAIPGYESIDLENNNLTVFPWEWKDNSIEKIYCCHLLEHFDRETGYKFLEECYRILEIGGEIRLAVPDLDKFVDCMLSGDYSSLGKYPYTSLDNFLGGGNQEPNEALRHKYLYTWDSLAFKLQEIGFVWIGKDNQQKFDNPEFGDISLYVGAVKNA